MIEIIAVTAIALALLVVGAVADRCDERAYQRWIKKELGDDQR